jgi:AraC family transcriptional regulator of adaptative response/methylated-DNA-[protein]-cysteine methyltransferase
MSTAMPRCNRCSVTACAVIETARGWVLAARSARGVCALEFGEEAGALAAEAARRFPGVALEVRASPASGSEWVEQVRAVVESPARAGELEVDLEGVGTAFERAVWAALRAIPAGEVVTYGELARRLGRDPAAARAVGRACGANRVAVAIPCHRVVGRDGGLTGYRWGLERKRGLLATERAGCPR